MCIAVLGEVDHHAAMPQPSAAPQSLALRQFHRRLRRIARLRLVTAVGLVLMTAAWILGDWKPRAITFFDRVSIGASYGCLTAGVHRELPASWGGARISHPLIGPIGVFNYSVTTSATAWRPYHAASFAAHHLVIPLWLPMLVASISLGLSHGYLRGIGWRDPRRCLHCGHDILPSEGATTCPECGLAQTTGSAPRRAVA